MARGSKVETWSDPRPPWPKEIGNEIENVARVSSHGAKKRDSGYLCPRKGAEETEEEEEEDAAAAG